jgi:excisionase family DNA binding protein
MSIASTGLSDWEGGRILDRRWDGKTTFSVPEVAEICGIGRSHAYAAVQSGDLPVVWIGRRAIIPRHALERLLRGEKPAA